MGSIIKALFSNIAKVVTGKFMSSDNLKALLQKLKPKFDELQSDINDVAEDVSTLSSTVGGHTSSISSLQSKDTALQKAVDEVESDVSVMQGTLTSVNNQATTNKNNIASLSSLVNGHTTDISDLEQDVKDNESAIAGKLSVYVSTSTSGGVSQQQNTFRMLNVTNRVTSSPAKYQLYVLGVDGNKVAYFETSADLVYIFNQDGQAPIKLDSLLDDLGNIVGSCAFFSKDVSNAINALSDYLPSIN